MKNVLIAVRVFPYRYSGLISTYNGSYQPIELHPGALRTTLKH